MPLMATFFFGALWHGFYFGYFAMYSSLALLDLTWKLVPGTKLAHLLSTLIPSFLLEHVISRVLSQALLGFTCIPFILLELNPILLYWKNLIYYGYVLMITSCVVSSLLPKAGKEGAKRSQTVEMVN